MLMVPLSTSVRLDRFEKDCDPPSIKGIRLVLPPATSTIPLVIIKAWPMFVNPLPLYERELIRRLTMLLLLPSLVDPENSRSSPLAGAVPPQFPTVPQKESAPPPFQVRRAACIPGTTPRIDRTSNSDVPTARRCGLRLRGRDPIGTPRLIALACDTVC